MKKVRIFTCFILALLLAACLAACNGGGGGQEGEVVIADNADYAPIATAAENKVRLYDGPSILKSSALASVRVEGAEVFVYESRVNFLRLHSWATPSTKAAVAMFDFSGRAEVSVAINGLSVTSAAVTPMAAGITPKIENGRIVFTLTQPGNYTVEANGDYKTALHIFANEIEQNPIDPNNVPEGTVYIGPGVYKAGGIPLADNQTLYVAGGAVVYGQLRLDNASNVTIRGRGIFDGSIFPRTKESEYTLPVEIRNSKNIKLEGLSFLDPAGWAITLLNCEDVTVDNIKIVTARSNGDGISVQSCKNVSVTRGFVRSWDDSLVVKNVQNKSTDNVTFDGVTVWTDLAQSMEIGYETYGEKLENVTFKNITVLHNFHKPAMSIHNSDQAAIKNILYQNITIEDAAMKGDAANDPEDDFLIDMRIAYDQNWSSSGGIRGTIKDVTFTNILVHKAIDTLSTRLIAADADKNIDGVHFNQISISGAKAADAEALKVKADVNVKNLRYTVNSAAVTGARLRDYYKNEAGSDSVSKTVQPNIEQSGIIVPAFARVDAEPPYAGQAIAPDAIRAERGTGRTTGSITGEFDNPAFPAARLIDGDHSTKWANKEALSGDTEFTALTLSFGAPKKIGLIRLFLDADNIFSSAYDVNVFTKVDGESNFKKRMFNTVFEISPASGNYCDIKIDAYDYTDIQIRLFGTKGIEYSQIISLSEIKLYPASLSYQKPIVDSSAYEDVYDPGKITDGDNRTYFESKKGVWPAFFSIDLGESYDVKYIILHLPPSVLWEKRTQSIQILGSNDRATYFNVAAAADYTFDPATGNRVSITLGSAVSLRYLKFNFVSNSAVGGYGAQVSEIYVYQG